jgi:SRSO17 transposase
VDSNIFVLFAEIHVHLLRTADKQLILFDLIFTDTEYGEKQAPNSNSWI